MIKKLIAFIVFLLIILPLLWFGYKFLFVKSDKGPAQLPPSVVDLATVARQPWQKTILEIGSLSAINGITVAPEISGRITNLFFKSGQYLKMGDSIVQIYPDIIKANLEKAKAQFHLNQIDYQRYLILYKKRFYAKSDLDKSKTAVEKSKAEIAMYEAQLKQTLIKAPFDGMIGLRKISIGDYLNAGDAIASFQSIDPMRVDFNVPETYLPQIQIGDKITFTSRAIGDKTREGNIYAFDSKLDEASRTLDIYATVPNSDHKLVPGTFVEVTVYLGKPQNPIMVAQTTIVYDTAGDYVYRAINHKAVKTIVTLGEKLDDNRIIITKGLTTGDIIITSGQLKIEDGSTIVTTEELQQQQQQQQNSQQQDSKTKNQQQKPQDNSKAQP
jgi:membrane fusion protein, multidrug efflux system